MCLETMLVDSTTSLVIAMRIQFPIAMSLDEHTNLHLTDLAIVQTGCNHIGACCSIWNPLDLRLPKFQRVLQLLLCSRGQASLVLIRRFPALWRWKADGLMDASIQAVPGSVVDSTAVG